VNRERPILFSAPMVRAILAGQKTQTRRVVKGIALDWLTPGMFTPEYTADPENGLCPYGKPGDRLWVREAWARTIVGTGTEMVVYREGDNRTDYGGPWKPGIHMFRRDSRITLEITGVRVERLQAISEADALAEGVEPSALGTVRALHSSTARDAYLRLWESINGRGSWAANPWVWVLDISVIRRLAASTPRVDRRELVCSG